MSHHLRQSSTFKRFSRDGFSPLNIDRHGHEHEHDHHSNRRSFDENDDNMNMAPPKDATIDIPLEPVRSNGGGLRNQTSTSQLHPVATTTTSQKERKHRFRGRRARKDHTQQQPTGGKHVGYDGEEDTITMMGRVYTAILNFSIVTRYFLYVSPLALMIAIPIIVGATAAKDAKIGSVRIVWFFTWVEIVWLSLWVSKIVAHYLPYVFQMLVGVVSSGVRKYSMILRSLEIPLSLVGWTVTSLATFVPLMTRNPDNSSDCNEGNGIDCVKGWQKTVQNVLGACVVASLVFLGEKAIVQLISINYHRKQFSARIKESKRNIFLLGLLYDASRTLFPAYCNEFAEEDYEIADQLNITDGIGQMSRGKTGHSRSGSATPMRLLQNVGRAGDKITSAFGNVASEITGRDVFNPNSAHSIVICALEKRRTSEALARRIWMSFVMEGRESLYKDDIADVLGPNRSTEAEEAFAALDGDGNGDISLDEMVLMVTEFKRERKSITTSMHDVDQAIAVLDRLLMAVAFIIIVLVFVGFLNANFTSTLATTGTVLLSLSFVFATTAAEVLGSCIFLFVKHPYDIGDRVDIGNSGTLNQQQFVVEHISLLFTVFRHVQGTGVGRLCQIPNIVLNTLWIENTSRSKAMTEQLTIDIAFETTFEDLQVLKNELLNFVTDKDNSRDFQPSIDLDVLGTSDQAKLQLLVEIKHKGNWANETIRRARRSKFMCALVSAMKTVPIYPPGGGLDAAGSAALPSYNVTISHDEALKNAEAAAKEREDLRLVPTKKADDLKSPNEDTPAGLTASDTKIVDDLTSRNPTWDPARDEAWTSSREDSSTLGDRPSIDRQDQEQIKGMLRRESTRGKRKPAASIDYAPRIPTISEPFQRQQQQQQAQVQAQYPYSSYTDQTPSPAYENQRPAYPPQQWSPPPQAQGQASNVPTRSPSNPYRQQQQQQRPGEDEEGKDLRPYSGV